MTYRMRIILEIIGRRNTDGTVIDLDQLIERVGVEGYVVTKAAIQFTLRAMVRKQLIEKCGFENRRDRRRVLYRLTRHGHDTYSALIAV